MWSVPAQLCAGLNDKLAFGDGFTPILVWQQREGGNWRVKSADLSTLLFNSTNDFQGSDNMDPALANVILVAKKEFPSQLSFLAFASDVTTPYQPEIYVNQSYWDSTMINISNHATMNLHPQFYSTLFHLTGYMTIYLFWESWRTGHYQIWVSNIDIPEGINEHGSDRPSSLKNYPNPFTRSTTIDYEITNRGSSEIAIFNRMGQQIRILKDGFDIPGKHSLVWDGNDENGNHVKPGIYICSMKINNEIIQRKISVL